jgi:hypothetical protein
MSTFKPGCERDDEPEWIQKYRKALDGTRAKKSVWLTIGHSLASVMRKVLGNAEGSLASACPNCGGSEIYLSRLRGWQERVLLVLLFRPVRCYRCMRRHYRSILVPTPKYRREMHHNDDRSRQDQKKPRKTA